MAEAVPSRRYPWFETVHGTELEQGDIVPGCPVFRPSAAASAADAPVEIIVNRLTGIATAPVIGVGERLNQTMLS